MINPIQDFLLYDNVTYFKLYIFAS